MATLMIAQSPTPPLQILVNPSLLLRCPLCANAHAHVHRCDWGLNGAAVAWGCVQASSCSGLLIFFLHHNWSQDVTKRTWAGFSREALAEWPLYIRVAIPSAVMICLDWWTFEVRCIALQCMHV